MARVRQPMSREANVMIWFTPLTSGGGGAANSTNYAINLTGGQAAIGGSSSTNYAVGLGYWYGVEQQLRVYLPIIIE